MDVWRLVSDMKDATEELDDKIKFLSGFVAAFKDQIHTDIHLKPGNDGLPIPAHKALMVLTLSNLWKLHPVPTFGSFISPIPNFLTYYFYTYF